MHNTGRDENTAGMPDKEWHVIGQWKKLHLIDWKEKGKNRIGWLSACNVWQQWIMLVDDTCEAGCMKELESAMFGCRDKNGKHNNDGVGKLPSKSSMCTVQR